MSTLKICFSLFVISLANSFAVRSLDTYKFGVKNFHWQDEDKLNRFLMDTNGDGKADRMDIILSNGMDAYSGLKKSSYTKKLKTRFDANSATHEYQVKEGKLWRTIKTKKITKINANEIDYEVWGENADQSLFRERLDTSALMLEENHTCKASPKKFDFLDFSGIQSILGTIPKVFEIDQSCLDKCEALKKKFKLTNISDISSCKFLFENLSMQSIDSTMSCLITNKKVKDVGEEIAHQIISNLRNDSFLFQVGKLYESGNVAKAELEKLRNQNQDGYGIKVKCVENKKFVAKTFGTLPGDKKEIIVDIADFVGQNEEALRHNFINIFGHELYHLGGFYHNQYELDTSYACNDCCNSKDDLSCYICNKSLEYNPHPTDHLLSALMFEKYVNPNNPFRAYHKTIEKLHAAIQEESFFADFGKYVPISKGEVVEKLYSQLITHLRNPVDYRGVDKLTYSDMIAEIMAKLTCADVGRVPGDERTTQDRYSCEVMYLARSIPTSYCFQKKFKESCVHAIRLQYARRKETNKTGIPLPDNFLSLDRHHD